VAREVRAAAARAVVVRGVATAVVVRAVVVRAVARVKVFSLSLRAWLRVPESFPP
jgi:hypothetical protein